VRSKREKKALPLSLLISRHPAPSSTAGVSRLSAGAFAQNGFGFLHHRHVTLAADGTRGASISLSPAQREAGSRLQEAAMPLIYVPLILYASWMEFLAQPFKASQPDREMLAAAAKIRRTVRRN
jgi:hypothetical protein